MPVHNHYPAQSFPNVFNVGKPQQCHGEEFDLSLTRS